MKVVIHKDFEGQKDQLDHLVKSFDTDGVVFGNQDRNTLKVFDLGDLKINVKSFRVPNIINQFVYKIFRKSKAQRSFEHAVRLTELGIGTPKPIAYYVANHPLLFKRSYYLSEHLDYDLTFRELTRDLNYPEHENILRAFTRFTYKLHENGIKFLDHSPGNTLIRKTADGYQFYLVDLNRMTFASLSLDERLKNFERLTKHESMVRTMSEEYAKCLGETGDEIFNKIWVHTQNFQRQFHRRQCLKRKLKFWKKSTASTS